jgi:hypothetical protein
MICQEREILFLRHNPPNRASPSPGNSVVCILFLALLTVLSHCPRAKTARKIGLVLELGPKHIFLRAFWSCQALHFSRSESATTLMSPHKPFEHEQSLPRRSPAATGEGGARFFGYPQSLGKKYAPTARSIPTRTEMGPCGAPLNVWVNPINRKIPDKIHASAVVVVTGIANNINPGWHTRV